MTYAVENKLDKKIASSTAVIKSIIDSVAFPNDEDKIHESLSPCM